MRDMMVETGTLTGHHNRLEAVLRVDLEAGRGEISGIVGPGGAVKTTTIRMLTNLQPSTSRSGTRAGFDIPREQARTDSEVGYVSQEFSFCQDLTMKENFDSYIGLFRMAQR